MDAFIALTTVSTPLETRSLGETGRESSVLTIGTFALQSLSQPKVNETVEMAIRSC